MEKAKDETMMRPYKLEDIPELIALVEKHVPQLPNYIGIKVAADRLAYLLRHNFGNSGYFQVWVLVNTHNKIVGAVAGYCTQGMITWDLIANDSFLCIEEEYRTLKRANQLVTVYKQWALARGAVLITASTRGGYRPEEFDIFMKRNGFDPVGTVYHLRMDEGNTIRQLQTLRKA